MNKENLLVCVLPNVPYHPLVCDEELADGIEVPARVGRFVANTHFKVRSFRTKNAWYKTRLYHFSAPFKIRFLDDGCKIEPAQADHRLYQKTIRDCRRNRQEQGFVDRIQPTTLQDLFFIVAKVRSPDYWHSLADGRSVILRVYDKRGELVWVIADCRVRYGWELSTFQVIEEEDLGTTFNGSTIISSAPFD